MPGLLLGVFRVKHLGASEIAHVRLDLIILRKKKQSSGFHRIRPVHYIVAKKKIFKSGVFYG